MKKLNEKEWKPIPMKRLFTKFVRGKVSSASDEPKRENGVPYVGATDRNNGVIDYLEADKAKIQPGNCVTFIRDGQGSVGSSVYRATPCVATVNTSSGYAKWLNQDTGLFVSTSSNQVREKYSFGYKRKETRLLAERVMLPVTDSGEPDYAYMAEYAQQIRDTMLAKYRAYVEERIAELGEAVEIPALVEKEWAEFRAFGDEGLFDIATTGSSIDGIRIIDGDTKKIPYVTRTDSNNGIARFVSDKNLSYGSDDAGCITVGLDTQTAFWQPHLFVTGQNIQVITGPQLNEWLAQFLIPLFRNQMKAKFNWGGNGATLGRMKRLELILPINSEGKPDYAYMEQYAKNMMLRKYEQYLAFIDKQNAAEEVTV